MTITQTVDIPADRRITLEVPREVPVGRTILAFTPAPDRGSTGRKVESSPESAKTKATPHSDALFAIFSQVGGDIDPDEIRSERLAKHLK
jgi:ABC-type transporter Mla subunit MlaD